MRTLFTFALLSAVAFSGVAVGQEETNLVGEVALESTETTDNIQQSIVDLDEPAPSDAEIDAPSIETATPVSVEGTIVSAEYVDQGVSYPESITVQDCGCQSGMIAPVVYQSPLIEGVVEGASEIAVEGSMVAEPVADATSVVESPITDSAPVYSDAGVVTEGAPMTVQSAPMATGTPSCGCNQGAAPAAMPTEGLISSSAVSYESAPAVYSSPAPAATPCCTPARRGFFRTLFGR